MLNAPARGPVLGGFVAPSRPEIKALSLGLGKPLRETRKLAQFALPGKRFGRLFPGKIRGNFGAFGARSAGLGEGPGVDVKVPSQGRGEPGGDDELSARRRQENLPSCEAQKREERLGAIAVELARDIVEQEDRLEPSRLGDRRRLRGLEGERERAVLPLRSDDARGVIVEVEPEVVAVRSEAGAGSVSVARTALAQLGRRLADVGAAARLEASGEREIGRGDVAERGEQLVLEGLHGAGARAGERGAVER